MARNRNSKKRNNRKNQNQRANQRRRESQRAVNDVIDLELEIHRLNLINRHQRAQIVGMKGISDEQETIIEELLDIAESSNRHSQIGGDRRHRP